MMLPAWLGAAAALQQAVDAGEAATLREMAAQWPYFETRLSMLEMVYSKTEARLSAHYDGRLVEERLRPLGESLRAQLADDEATVLQILGQREVLERADWARESLALRNVYTNPLNILQAELLARLRSDPQDAAARQATMITIAGVAAGMRNTG